MELEVPMDGDNVKPYFDFSSSNIRELEFLVITYDVPFGLNVDKLSQELSAPIVTKDGKNGERGVEMY